MSLLNITSSCHPTDKCLDNLPGKWAGTKAAVRQMEVPDIEWQLLNKSAVARIQQHKATLYTPLVPKIKSSVCVTHSTTKCKAEPFRYLNFGHMLPEVDKMGTFPPHFLRRRLYRCVPSVLHRMNVLPVRWTVKCSTAPKDQHLLPVRSHNSFED